MTYTNCCLYRVDPPDDEQQAYSKHVEAYFFHTRNLHLHIIKDFYLPTDAQENCFKRNIKIYIKTAPTCFGLITIIRERTIPAC